MIKQESIAVEFLHLRNKLHITQRYYNPDGKRLLYMQKAIRKGNAVAFWDREESQGVTSFL